MNKAGMMGGLDRQRRGRQAERCGRAAEASAERLYAAEGAVARARRWRGQGGEIDLIVAEPDETIVFVEVKARRRHAAEALGAGQRRRLLAAAEEWLGQFANRDAPCRFDLVLVDGAGRPDRIANALMA